MAFRLFVTRALSAFFLLGWVGLVVSVPQSAAVARTYHLVTAEFWPFTGKYLPDGGMLVSIAREALAAQGHELIVSYRPWSRAMMEVKAGTYDGLLSAFYTEERAREFLFSRPINDTWMVLLAKAPQEKNSYSSYEEFAGKTIAVGRNWAYSPEFSSSPVFSRYEVNDEISGIKMLLAERIDYFAVNFHQALFNLKQAGLKRSDFVFLLPAISNNSQHLAAPRTRQGSKELIAEFDKGLLALQQSGRLQEIKQIYSQQHLARD
ncbi:substrate-binding periplasmic protein [Rhodovibrionaceae bacterium A322]